MSSPTDPHTATPQEEERLTGNHTATLPKEERLTGKKRIDSLFGTGGLSMAAFPLRVVYREEEGSEGTAPVVFMVSVPKRLLRRAVDRNRAKRLVREAYRQQRHLLTDTLRGRHVALAFLWISPQPASYETVRKRVRNLLLRVGEALDRTAGKRR